MHRTRPSLRIAPRVLALLLCLALALVPAAPAAASPTAAPAAQAEGIALRLAFVPGETRRYATFVEMTMDMAPVGSFDAAIDVEMTYVVESVHDDGSATVLATIDRMDIYANGAPESTEATELMAGFTSRVRMLPDGQITEVVVDPATLEALGVTAGQPLPRSSSPGSMGSAFSGVILPPVPLAIGQSFERDLSVNLASLGLPGVTSFDGPLSALSVVTLEDVTDASGRPTALLTEVGTASLPPFSFQEGLSLAMEMGVHSSYEVDVETGWQGGGESEVHGTVTFASVEGDTMTMEFVMRALRQAL